MGYKATVLFGALVTYQYKSLFAFDDFWGFKKNGEGPAWIFELDAYHSIYRDWRSIVCLAYTILVLNPFETFLIFAHAKFWLTMFKLSKLPWWGNWLIFFPMFVLFVQVLSLPWLVNRNIMNLFWELMVGDNGYYELWYQPLSGGTGLLMALYVDEPIPDWLYGYVWTFDKKGWVTALLWVFVVVPVTIFTYYIWESVRLRGYRLQFWAFLMRKIFGAADDEALGEHQSRRGSAGSRRGSGASSRRGSL